MTPERKTQFSVRRRNGLLALVHIAKRDLGLDDDLYRMILKDQFGVLSASALASSELERLMAWFERRGFRRQPKKDRGERAQQQIEALRDKAEEAMAARGFSPKRRRGLLRKICGVEDLGFCRDSERLRRLLAVIPRLED